MDPKISHAGFPFIIKCHASTAFEKFLNKKGLDKTILNDAIRVVSESPLRFDWYNIDKPFSCLRFGNKEKYKKKGKVAGGFLFENGELKIRFAKHYGRKESKRITLKEDVKYNETQILKAIEEERALLEQHGLTGNGHWPTDYEEVEVDKGDDDFEVDDIDAKPNEQSQKQVNQSLSNQILYGPPGTGKTYRTIEAAVKIAEPDAYSDLKTKEKAGATPSQREELKKFYNELLDDNRIQFVTFHQSYGYEEFVEGLKAKTKDDGSIYYDVEPGVFKRICENARNLSLDPNSDINVKGNVWKISIESTRSNEAKTYCLENNLAAIGWADTGDLSAGAQNSYLQSLGPNDRNSLLNFSERMDIGDIVLCINSNTSVEAIGVVSGDYSFDETGIPSRQDYCHQRKVNWLAKGFSVDFKTLNNGKQFTLPTCYPLARFSVSSVIQHLQENGVVVAKDAKPTEKNYVLIIDEINRGNISKIFGELITLIEPSKRMGQPEALEVVLPYSDDKFSVPDNLYIIGTMNTADRSLALMDTALRRRFDFVEMMPDYEVLKNDSGNPYIIETDNGDIELCALLDKLNQRISALYDREHMLGHAFFIPVVERVAEGDHDLAIEALKWCFLNKIIPLLTEYFFEDWQKIRLVLADNQKQQATFTPLIKSVSVDFGELFGTVDGSEIGDEQVSDYLLADADDDIWLDPKTYIGMYDLTALKLLNQPAAETDD